MGALEKISEIIEKIGFTKLEAEIYTYLLPHSPATGYKIAKGIGRSFTNTYKAISGLEAKGAVLVDEGSNRLCRAVPLEELLDQIERRFSGQRREALELARQIPDSSVDTRIYQLHSADQVYARFRALLSAAEERILMELFPEPLEELRGDIEATAARGIHVAVRVYEPTSLKGVRTILSPYGEHDLESIPSQWLAIFIDGEQFLLGDLFPESRGVYRAAWSANPFMARAFFDYVNSDLHHYSFHAHLETAETIEELREKYNQLREEFPPGGDLGWKRFIDQFHHSTSDKNPSGKKE